jgi:hypothetical protein
VPLPLSASASASGVGKGSASPLKCALSYGSRTQDPGPRRWTGDVAESLHLVQLSTEAAFLPSW